HARDRGVQLLVDAEYTYLNPALSWVTMALMMRFNQSEPAIWNTYQCYLKDADTLLSSDIEWALSRGLCFGVKLVRGAYLEKERLLAKSLGYPDPIQPTWEDTNHSYQRLLDKMLRLVGETGQRLGLVIATHNEESVRHALHRMQEFGIRQENHFVCFAQLLGMCDHISLTLGSAGYSVYKSIPYGSVEEVMPYLVRRAQENLSVLKGLRTERDLLWRELRTRLTRKRRPAV
ncbi:hydroxyproline dehydrogenase, partial [Carcharodon carcharias]|uniref:hydroxyproline dehydrogenase n=1 Tax=Carcharodon carcharias TaxID=13397 RepID=UPI001B7DE987